MDKAVTAGVITADQKQKILDELAKIKNENPKQKGEFTQWLKDNGIDQSKLQPYLGRSYRSHR